MPKPNCYLCKREATSSEHAPPRCFFPEEKDFGRNLRNNLVTVPSCDLHNSKKSKDDEYFRTIILMQASRFSDPAKHLFLRKVIRAASRKSQAYASFFADAGTLNDGAARALQIDRDRFDRCVDHMARALFFSESQAPWNLRISVISPNFFSEVSSDNAIPHEDSLAATAVTRQFLQSEEIRGENPEVFRYRLKYDESTETFALAAQFYEAFEVFTYSSRELHENFV